jgi:hypothetical protein
MEKIPLLVAFAALLLCSGCSKPLARGARFQRFVLLEHPSQIKKDIPDGALALDTQTGQLCYTVGGDFTSGYPAMDMCAIVAENHP